MPYTIKATYYGQMRKLRPFHPAGLPSWDELNREIQQVFWRAENFGITNVQLVDRWIFDPIILNDGGLIADSLDWDTQIRCAVESRYDLSASTVLKFDVVDIPHAETTVKQEVPTTSATRAEPVGESSAATAAAESVRSATPTQKAESCCSVSSAKRDVAELLKKFTADFESLTVDFRASEDGDKSDDEAAVPSPPTRSTPLPTHRNIAVICDGCDNGITGKRYKCETCSNFDFCEECYNLNKTRFGTYGHPHSFKLASLNMGATWSAPAAAAQQPESADAGRHSAFCDSCFRPIWGVRHKCSDCLDYDLCASCISQRTVVHQPDHQFVTISEPGEVIMWDQGDNTNAPDIVRAFPDAAPAGSEFTLHAATCDICDAGIAGVRYKCLDCPDYDLCSGCLTHRKELHDPAHHFLLIDRPTNIVKHIVPDRRPEGHGHHSSRHGQPHHRRRHAPAPEVPTAAPAPTTAPTPAPAPFPASSPSASAPGTAVRPVHPATCDMCSSKIVGVRYKCVECPDYDTCESCFAITEEQHPEHSFIRISNPTDYIHRSHGSSTRRLPSHHARCNACNERISSSGPRYKCTHPACLDFDLCPNCEALPHPVHPLEHVMLKLRVPASMIEPRELLVHEPREAPAQHPAQCDYCGSKIVGIRYKCAECDDFDLCQACETLPTSHNRSHVLMKIKVPMYTRTRAELRSPPPTTSNNPFVSPEDATTATPEVPAMPQPTEPETVVEEPVAKNMTQRRAASVFIEALLNAAPVSTPPIVDAPVHSATADASELHGIFLEDLSIPDGHPLPPNSHFIKRWRLLNPGPQAWPANTELRFTGGDAMGSPEAVTVGPVDVGEEKIVEVEMQAGTSEGKQVGFWSLGQDGQLFGHRLWVEIEVINIMNASMQASTLAGSGSGSLDSSVVVMPTAPSIAGSAAEAEGPAPVSPIYETAPANEPQVDSDIEESSHPLSSNVSIVSFSDAGSDDEDWNDATIAGGHRAGMQVPEVDDGWADVADALERDAHRVNTDLEADVEDAALRDRAGYVLVYDETEEE
ncbi:hypothetical protein CALVIDRAFT_114052 [Calocera viscosa TUFC12733]|uniref:ZZ-type domain-containing protein n=1 Tax=Calocera viscosa (strain TUFC12733) TaxID=1330018 RepID=A0A167M5P9_CALVF|nr:hypothetical protein CALVIDRAFT_114052 [Calocera viscosa TUFC12733]